MVSGVGFQREHGPPVIVGQQHCLRCIRLPNHPEVQLFGSLSHIPNAIEAQSARAVLDRPASSTPRVRQCIRSSERRQGYPEDRAATVRRVGTLFTPPSTA